MNFFVVIHIDRFSDLALVVGGNAVTVTPWTMSGERVMVCINGEEEIILRLERSLARIRHILSIAPAFEKS